jgi:CRP-like cAMP-binding protein
VTLTVLSSTGKAAVVGMLSTGDFCGEGCLAGQPMRMGSATTVLPTSVLRIPGEAMQALLHSHGEFAERFLAHMPARNIRIEEDLVDQLFNSSEKRLARPPGPPNLRYCEAAICLARASAWRPVDDGPTMATNCR